MRSDNKERQEYQGLLFRLVEIDMDIVTTSGKEDGQGVGWNSNWDTNDIIWSD